MIGHRYTIGDGHDVWTVIRRGEPFMVGGPSGNVLIERRSDGHRMVRPFRGLRRFVH